TELGVPRWALFLIGLSLVVAFLALFASFLRGIGLRREDSYWRWVLTVQAGLLCYLAMIAGARFLWPTDGQLPPTANDLLGLAASPVVVMLLATCTYAFPRVGRGQESSATEPRWAKAGMVFALGLLFMATEVLFFSYDYEAAAAAQPVQRDGGGAGSIGSAWTGRAAAAELGRSAKEQC